ncbi:MAG: glycosyltransferase family 9 protein, partial [Gammaproteobacteria bacterium]
MVPVVRSIQEQWPETKITWCLGRQEHRLLGDISGIEFVVFDKSSGWAAYSDLRRAMRSRRFDVLMHAQFSMRSNVASRMVRSALRLGYDRERSKDLHGCFITHRIPPGERQHVMDSYFSFAETLGVGTRNLNWNIPLPAEALEYLVETLPANQPFVVINPCSSHSHRNWSSERYARIADYASQRHGMRIVLCGGKTKQEDAMGKQICSAMSAPAINLIGKDTIKQLLATLSQAKLLITPDSGPMHMATAVGTPVIGLHAASNPERSGPYFSRQWCVNRYDDAARKFLGRDSGEIRWGTKIERPGVMDLVTVDDVVEKLDGLLE